MATISGGGVSPPPPMDPPPNIKVTIDHHRENPSLPLGKSCWAIFGTQTFGSQTPPPPPLLILP